MYILSGLIFAILWMGQLFIPPYICIFQFKKYADNRCTYIINKNQYYTNFYSICGLKIVKIILIIFSSFSSSFKSKLMFIKIFQHISFFIHNIYCIQKCYSYYFVPYYDNNNFIHFYSFFFLQNKILNVFAHQFVLIIYNIFVFHFFVLYLINKYCIK